MFRKINKMIILFSFVSLILWDIFSYKKEENSTFSVIMTDWYYDNPIISIMICLFVGALMGHWFAPARGSKD